MDKKKLPRCPRFEYHDMDKCETVCDFEQMKAHCPLIQAGYRLPPEDRDLREAVRTILKNDECRECLESLHLWNTSTICINCKIEQILSLFPMEVLSEEYLSNKFQGWRENSITRTEARHMMRDQISQPTVDKNKGEK